MPPKKDLTNQKFNQLLVIREATAQESNFQKGVFWICRCDCGNITVRRGVSITSGNVKSCGCNKKRTLVGKKFQKLTVISSLPNTKSGKRQWLCSCSCGGKRKTTTDKLRSGRVTSCLECVEKQSRVIDLSGQQFGKLTVLSRKGSDSRGEALWQCQCSECGMITNVLGSNLRTGNTESCGICSREKDLTGFESGHLRVIQKSHKKNGDIFWVCKCELCGKTCIKSSKTILSGHSKSCGCLKRFYKNQPQYEIYADRIGNAEEIRREPKNSRNLQVKCLYCGQWFTPTIPQIQMRIYALNNLNAGEARLYCSQHCKASCPTYGRKEFPKRFRKASSREVLPDLRKIVLARDNYECQHTNCSNNIKNSELHVHHIIGATQEPLLSNDIDNCITLCRKCHKMFISAKDAIM